jgi:signal transduction histidine kinase
MGRRLQARRDELETRALVRLTSAYLAIFASVIGVLSVLAYRFVESNYRSIVAPALDTPEGRAGFAAALRPALYAILSFDALLLALVGAASFALARAALRPLVAAREREERFAADVAHELRTPLGAIASLAQAGPEGPAAAQALATIARRALECGDLVGDLLTLARASDPQELSREPVDVAMLTRRVEREVAADAPGVTFEASYADAIVDGDERRLTQLARNLIWNARAHAASRVTIDVRAAGGNAVVTVEDDGPGVAPEIQSRLFERFAKGSESRGSGLGLAISRWVARAHGGDVTFAGGSRFIARIPLAGGAAT